MKLLGIHSGHNASACLLVDGKIQIAIQEERLCRIKNYTGFPEMAVKFILDQARLTMEDVDKVAYTDIYYFNPKIFMEIETAKSHFNRNSPPLAWKIKAAIEKIKPFGELATNLRVIRKSNDFQSHGLPKEKLVRVDHHTAHAASAYYGWGCFEKPVLVLTCDGSGDGLSATVSIGKNGTLERIASVQDKYSIGLIYSMATLLLGMKPNEHEYKLMGMAPYAHSEDGKKLAKKFSQYFQMDDKNPLGWRTTSRISDTYCSYQTLRKDFEFERFDAVCAGLQLWIEDFLANWVHRCIKHTGIRSVALCGGVFMNVKANQRILDLDEVDELFVFPSCGDETNPFGASMLTYAQQSGVNNLAPLGPVYLGKAFTDDEINGMLQEKASQYKIECPSNLPRTIAQLIKNGEVVARFSGRDEFGARALGNRSILADPSRTDVIRVINNMIKNRDFWMPFACSIKSEREKDYIINPKNVTAPYMIITFNTTDRRAEIVAGTHPYDGTARPQIVYKEHNPEYHQIISEFESISGIGAVLNTSFNLHGYPIVHTPDDALQVFINSGLKYLTLGSFLISKE